MNEEIKLSESEIAKIRGRAQAKVMLELKKDVEDKLYAEMIVEERAKFELQEELVPITIDVPAVNIIDPLSMETGVSINGKKYIHGQTYEVPRSLAGMINHNMFCANRNENAIGNPNRDYNVRKKVDARNPSA